MAQKDLELRPVMTRIPEGLRRRLEREANRHRTSMNAEIVKRLQESFDIPDQAGAIASDVASEISSELDDVSWSLIEIQSQNRAILSHLGLPDPAEDRQRVREELRALAEARRRKEAERRKAATERAEAARRPEAGPSTDWYAPVETGDGEKK
jgi:hypothetical protein